MRKAGRKKVNIDPKAIVPRSEHSLSRQNINQNPLKVLHKLKQYGYDAYLVGGSVRDILLHLTPKDFDIATDAKPNDVKAIFKNCRLIGRRFRLAHVHFGREIVEVATFRSANEETKTNKAGMIKCDNVYGNIIEDAWRRDITINALYYNIKDFSIVDLTGGIKDLHDKIIRVIGKPDVRYTEDPVRMLRVVRLAAKLDFTIEATTAAPITSMAHLLQGISNARLFDEVVKLFHTGAALPTFNLLREFRLFGQLFPVTEKILKKSPQAITFIQKACLNTDARIKEGKTVTPAFLFAVMLWEPYRQEIEHLTKQDLEELTHSQIRSAAMANVLHLQNTSTSIPKAFTTAIREIWQLQHRLCKLDKRSLSAFEHPRFRAAYDFLVLYADIHPEYKEQAQWWTKFQEVDAITQSTMIRELSKS